MSETRTVYVAYTNTDCTEGLGTWLLSDVIEWESMAKHGRAA